MALPVWVPVTVDELKDELDSPTDKVRLDARLERILTRAAARVEAHVGHRLIYRGTPYVEHHSLPAQTGFFYPLEYPIIAVTSIHEDAAQLYGAETLVDPLNYIVAPGDLDGRSRARIMRTEGWYWLSGPRYQKLVYSAGFASRAVAPADLKDVVLQLSALMWRQVERKAQGEMVTKDVSGATVRFTDRSLTSVHLTDEMKEALQPYVREDYMPTGERAA